MNAHQRRIEHRRWERNVGIRSCPRCFIIYKRSASACPMCGYRKSPTTNQGKV